MSKKTTVLMILDGFGLNDKTEGNAVAQAKKPNIDALMREYPFVKGNASGLAVGLPDGQMGNSEVGHLNMGAGRIVYQELTRITKEINDGEFFSNQIEYAGAVILSRTDKAKPEKIQESVALLRELNEKAPIITTPIEQLPGEKILETMESSKSLEDELLAEVAKEAHDHEHHHHHDHEECDHEHHHHHDHEECDHEHHHHHDHEEHEHHHHDGECSCGCGHHHHHDHEGHHHADEVFTSWGKETIHTYTKDEVSAILKTLEEDGSYGNVLRAKGMVAGADGEWIYFDMVPEEHEVRTGAPEYTGRICVIGAELNEDKLAELFKLK